MAEREVTQGEIRPAAGKPAGGGGLARLISLTGAVVSLGLLVGVGIWGYKLVVRDVSGIPVVRAVEGPMRVQPENPGGRPADHQGLAVNAVAADGSAAPPADTLVLAPRPVSLADEDAPQSQITRPAIRHEPEPDTPEDTVAASLRSGDIDALVAQITDGVAPLSEAEPETGTAPVTARIVAPEPLMLDTEAETPQAAEVPEPAVALDVPGVTRSLRPRIRPAGGPPIVAPTPVVADATGGLDIAAADVPAGTRVVQLGAFESADQARSEWDRLAAQFADYLLDKRRIVQEASSGGRTFFRLRAMGFEDLSDARRFCSALVSEGADCIPVVTR